MEAAITATQHWFEERTEAWLYGRYDRLLHSGGVQPAINEMIRRRAMLLHRGGVDRKVICDVRVRDVRVADDAQGEISLVADEHIRFLYEIGDDLEHEQRKITHVFTWNASHRSPVLVRHLCGTEAQPVLERSSRTKVLAEKIHEAREGVGYRGGYDRTLAYRYAERWWNERNPEYVDMGDDCTNYISQVLRAGGFPMIGIGRRDQGWWYQFGSRPNWSFSWAVAHSLAMLLMDRRNYFRVSLVDRPEELVIGDVIAYDWDGSGRFRHTTVVTGQDTRGLPLINAHTVDSHHRFYSYEDSYAWTPKTKYVFIHFVD